MKRFSNLFDQVCNIENLMLADQRAIKGKTHRKSVIAHLENRESNIAILHQALTEKRFATSQYRTFTIREPKERVISSLPYYPDTIVHYAIMNVLEPVWVSIFTKDTYSCIKGRGLHSAGEAIKKGFENVDDTRYCLKIDIKKFYPSIDHSILKEIIRKKIKDKDLLWLLDGIIESAPGLPIGNYLSQYLANLYLTYFDHWIKETMRIQDYFRYCDDIVIFYHSKVYLHQLLSDIRWYLKTNLNLTVKANYQIFPVESRGVDFLGYVFRHGYTRLRKSIKKSYARAVANGKSQASLAAYQGWAKHANTLNLTKKLNDIRNTKLQGFRDSRRKQGDGRRQNRYVPGSQ